MRAATSRGVGVGRPRLEAVDLEALSRGVLFLAVKVVPAAVAGGGDAARLEREVVGIGRLRERLLEGDQILAPERHERLVEGLHAVARVAARDGVTDLARPLGDGDALADERGRYEHLDGR